MSPDNTYNISYLFSKDLVIIVTMRPEKSFPAEHQPDAAISYAGTMRPNNFKRSQIPCRRYQSTYRENGRTLSSATRPATDFDYVIHVGIPLGENVQTEPNFVESTALPKIDNIKGRGCLQRGFLLRFLSSN